MAKSEWSWSGVRRQIYVHAAVAGKRNTMRLFRFRAYRVAQAARLNFGIGLIGFDFQRSAQVHVAQLSPFLVGIDPYRAGGRINLNRALCSF